MSVVRVLLVHLLSLGFTLVSVVGVEERRGRGSGKRGGDLCTTTSDAASAATVASGRFAPDVDGQGNAAAQAEVAGEEEDGEEGGEEEEEEEQEDKRQGSRGRL